MRKWRKTSSFKTHRTVNVARVMAKVAKKRFARAHEAISEGEIRAKAGQVVAVLRVAMGGPAVNGDFVAMADPITIGGPVAMARPAALAAMLS